MALFKKVKLSGELGQLRTLRVTTKMKQEVRGSPECEDGMLFRREEKVWCIFRLHKFRLWELQLHSEC